MSLESWYYNMTTGNESDVADIDFEKEGVMVWDFTLFSNFKKFLVSRQQNAWLQWGLNQNEAF